MKNTKEDLRQLAYVDANFSINFYNCVRDAVHSDAKISDVVFNDVSIHIYSLVYKPINIDIIHSLETNIFLSK